MFIASCPGRKMSPIPCVASLICSLARIWTSLFEAGFTFVATSGASDSRLFRHMRAHAGRPSASVLKQRVAFCF